MNEKQNPIVPEVRPESPSPNMEAKDMDTKSADHDETMTTTSIATPEKASEGTAEAEQDKEEETEYPKGLSLALLLASSCLAVFMFSIDQTIVGTAIPQITKDFHSLDDVSWYAAAYFLTLAATQTSTGKAYTHFDLKWSFITAMVIFELGSLICGVAQNSTTLIVGRAVGGIGGAGLAVGATSIASLSVPAKQRPMVFGGIGMAYSVSALLGPIIGGLFTERVTWRWCFYINLPIGGLCIAFVFFFFTTPESAKPPVMPLKEKLLHLDPVGVCLTVSAIICYILALQYAGNTHPWDSAVVIGLFVGFVLITAVTVAWEMWLGEYAMMQRSLWKRRSLYASAFVSFFVFGTYVVVLYYLPIYFQSIRGESAIQSGVDNFPLVVAAGVFTVVGGIFVTATGYAQILMSVGAALATVACGLLYTFDKDTSTAYWAGIQFFVGAAIAVFIMQPLGTAQAFGTAEQIPALTANVMFFQTMGGAFSSSAAQSAFINQMLHVLPSKAPNVDPQVVLFSGAAELKDIFSSQDLPGVLSAYIIGIRATFLVATAFAGFSFLGSFMVPWGRLPTHGKKGAAPVAMA